MDYIINPMWFYWINVADRLHTIFGVASVLLGITEIVFVVIAVTSYLSGKGYGPDDPDIQTAKAMIKPIIICGIVLAVTLVGAVFIPAKDVLIEMTVAKFATLENTEWTVETIKSAVDYIVEAIAKVNGG